jgi:hypothetical protein
MSERRRRTIVCGASVVAAAVVAVTASGAPRSSTGQGMKASLSAGKGFFVGKLQGRTLAWSLAYRRAGAGGVAARLHIGKTGLTTTLCSPCRNPARGARILSATAAQALRASRGYVDVRELGTSVSLRGQIVAGSVPALEILSPKPGATLPLPGQISYRVTGLAVETGNIHLRVYIAGSDGGRVDVPLPDESGVALLPDVKNSFLVGKHDLIFQLTTDDAVALPNSESKVTVSDVTVEGRRSP